MGFIHEVWEKVRSLRSTLTFSHVEILLDYCFHAS